LSQKQADKAVSALNQSLDKNSKNIVAWNLKGEVLLAQDKKDEAIKIFEKAIDIDPKYPFPYQNIASVNVAKGDKARAVESFNQGIKATDGAPRLVFGLASLYESMGEMDSAIKVYEGLYAKNPQSLAAANNMAMLLAAYKNDGASLAKAKKLIEPLKSSDNPAYLDTVGWVQYKSGQFDEAINALQKAVDKAPNQPLLHYHLGMAFYSKGDKQQAKSNLEIAVKTESNFKGKDEAQQKLNELSSING